VTDRTLRKLTLVACGVALLGIIGEIVLALLVGKDTDHGWTGTLLTVIAVLGQIGLLAIGVLILRRQHTNRMGWWFIALSLSATLWMASGAYASYALLHRQPPLAVGGISAWISHWSLPLLLSMFIPLFLLFPSGRAVAPRWRWVTWLWAAAMTVSVVGWALSGTRIDVGNIATGGGNGLFVVPPFNAGPWINQVTTASGLVTLLTAVAALVSLFVRYRRGTEEERQQIRWLRFVGIAFFAIFAFNIALEALAGLFASQRVVNGIGNVMFSILVTLLVLGLPGAAGVAILKYRLYDLDVVIRKTVVFGLLAGFVTAVYALVVGGVGALVGSRSNTVLSFAAAAVLAIAFQPVRARARRLADRLVYGKRATPYEVLAEFSDRMAETYATEDVLPRMAEILRGGTGAVSARVWLHVGKELVPVASAGDARDTGAVEIAGDVLSPIDGEHAVEVRHQGELLGALSVRMPPSDPMNPQREKLVRDLAAQAGLVLRNVRLISELRASRQRLVAAQDEERRKLERNLHDGAQQQLVALAVKLRLAEQLTTRDADKARDMLTALQQDTQDALENLRDLARGIYPPLLADKGLGAALEGQARKASIPVQISTDGAGRYPQETEAAVYFCCLEALQNIQKYANATTARVRLAQQDGVLRFEVEDDGAGFDADATGYGTGLQGMADRLDAIGGTLDVRSAPGGGTTIVGSVPVGPVAEDQPTED
jgi:signal transduction histidine kinase